MLKRLLESTQMHIYFFPSVGFQGLLPLKLIMVAGDVIYQEQGEGKA